VTIARWSPGAVDKGAARRYNAGVNRLGPLPDRDRMSVLVGTLVLGLALMRLIDLPDRFVHTTVLGSPLGIQVSTTTVMLALITALAATGMESLARSHPNFTNGRRFDLRSLVHAIQPALAVLLLGAQLAQAQPWTAWWLGLGITAILTALVLAAEYMTVDPAQRQGALGLAMTALNLLLALASFTLIYSTRARSFLTATEASVVAGLLALRLLWGMGQPLRQALIYAGAIGLALGECLWALNYWRATPLLAGLLLVLIYYAMTGIAQQHERGALDRRVLAEFGLVALVGLVIILRFAR
jgi:hypothetical protein